MHVGTATKNDYSNLSRSLVKGVLAASLLLDYRETNAGSSSDHEEDCTWRRATARASAVFAELVLAEAQVNKPGLETEPTATSENPCVPQRAASV
ncbi:hypothetical protein HPB50_018815 [Hyalomma asiaticum]|uniref:Uncharacterized protein n=1 Tax=Hyalomma asiaticum TaxID=266040 RepID=A0ACB7SGT9_HYAAI|nr:hypothetical protein HPB50_018815 [Hyalomma asiaticum]